MQTPEEIEQTVAGFRAWLEGKPFQIKFGVDPEWHTIKSTNTELNISRTGKFAALLRPKPEPKLRPWRAEEVPVGAAFRPINSASPTAWLDTNSLGVQLGCSNVRHTFQALKNFWEHSTDGGKTWHRCGVMEDAP